MQVDTFGNTDPDQYGNRKIAIGALHVLKQVVVFEDLCVVVI